MTCLAGYYNPEKTTCRYAGTKLTSFTGGSPRGECSQGPWTHSFGNVYTILWERSQKLFFSSMWIMSTPGFTPYDLTVPLTGINISQDSGIGPLLVCTQILVEISDLNLQSQGRQGWKPHVVVELCCWRFSLEQSPYSLLFYEALTCSERGIGLPGIGSRFFQKVEGWPPNMDLMGYRFVEGNSALEYISLCVHAIWAGVIEDLPHRNRVNHNCGV